MMNAMLGKATELGFSEVSFTTRPDVMKVGYGLYQRMGFEETAENDGVVSMRIMSSRDGVIGPKKTEF